MRALPVVVLALIGCGPSTPPVAPAPAEPPVASPDADPEAWSEEGGEPSDVEPDPDPDPGPDPDPPARGGRNGPGPTAQAFLDAHNQVRAQHCAPPLAWSTELAEVAQGWADQLGKAGCAFEHSRSRYGENLAAGTSGALSPASVTEMWYREVDGYDFRRGGFSMTTGHFTQVVWIGTTAMGCGVTTCGGMDIYVCNYDPPGNVQGQFQRQVKAKGCRPSER